MSCVPGAFLLVTFFKMEKTAEHYIKVYNIKVYWYQIKLNETIITVKMYRYSITRRRFPH